MTAPTVPTFGVPVAAAEPYQVASEVFEEVVEKWRRAVEAAAKAGDREAALDLATLDRDIQALSREFDDALTLLGIGRQEREEQAARARSEVANLRMDARNMAEAIEKAAKVIEALR